MDFIRTLFCKKTKPIKEDESSAVDKQNPIINDNNEDSNKDETDTSQINQVDNEVVVKKAQEEAEAAKKAQEETEAEAAKKAQEEDEAAKKAPEDKDINDELFIFT